MHNLNHESKILKPSLCRAGLSWRLLLFLLQIVHLGRKWTLKHVRISDFLMFGGSGGIVRPEVSRYIVEAYNDETTLAEKVITCFWPPRANHKWCKEPKQTNKQTKQSLHQLIYQFNTSYLIIVLLHKNDSPTMVNNFKSEWKTFCKRKHLTKLQSLILTILCYLIGAGFPDCDIFF